MTQRSKRQTSKDELVTLDTLNQFSHSVGSLHRISNTSTTNHVMTGRFDYCQFASGLSIHITDAIEKQSLNSSTEIEPSLSCNILVQGTINFQLGKDSYQISAQTSQAPLCWATALSRPEILSRRTQQGMAIKKVNLFATRSWLEQRCITKTDRALLTQIFSNHGGTYQWQANDKLTGLTQQLADVQLNTNMATNLKAEAICNEILAIYLNQLKRMTSDKVLENACQGTSNKTGDVSLKSQVDEHILKGLSLVVIATELGMSISTLQRKFKSETNLTVAEYIRYRRLEIARGAMIHKGLSIKEAAYLAGYRHTPNFNSAFKKYFSITPAQLRDSHGQLD